MVEVKLKALDKSMLAFADKKEVKLLKKAADDDSAGDMAQKLVAMRKKKQEATRLKDGWRSDSQYELITEFPITILESNWLFILSVVMPVADAEAAITAIAAVCIIHTYAKLN